MQLQQSPNELIRLWTRYLEKTATEAERNILMELLATEEGAQALAQISESMDLAPFKGDQPAPAQSAAIFEALQQVINADQGKNNALPGETGSSPVRQMALARRWYWAAAVLAILVTGASFWLLSRSHTSDTSSLAGVQTDIAPGKEGAILTLADGSRVVLDSLGNGIIATQGSATARIDDGALVYAGKAGQERIYNTLSTPKGRQFQLLLPDGTKVWLNAASSIRYPIAFDGKERKVEVTGEAYFEVAPHLNAPFIVQTTYQQIQVLGTSFNVNAYDNEGVTRTTLIEGAVRIAAADAGGNAGASRQPSFPPLVLEPGQQAVLSSAGPRQQLSIKHDQSEVAIAWISGAFNFEGLSLEEAMRQLERWYDIDVVYENGIPDVHFWGKMSRGVSLAGLLKILSGAQLKCRIEEGRKLVVMK